MELNLLRWETFIIPDEVQVKISVLSRIFEVTIAVKIYEGIKNRELAFSTIAKSARQHETQFFKIFGGSRDELRFLNIKSIWNVSHRFGRVEKLLVSGIAL
jgi:hypothetical protein